MKNFALAVTMLVVVAASSPAQAAPKQDFCTSSKATLFICTATAVTIGLAIVSLAEGKPRKPLPLGSGSDDPNMWNDGDDRERDEDTSIGCAWGDRKYDTCH